MPEPTFRRYTPLLEADPDLARLVEECVSLAAPSVPLEPGELAAIVAEMERPPFALGGAP